MEEWKEYKLGDLIVLSSGGTPNKSNSSYWDGDIPWISAKAMYDDYLYTSDITITREGLNHGSKLAPVNSILLLTRGSGLFNRIPVCLVKREMAFNQDVKCIESKDKNVVSNIFLFYWLMGHKREISNILETTGIGAGKIDTERLKNLSISLSPIQTQLVLIKFAESLILKIEVNRRINENLEQQAQALFKSWFVDFEPFKNGEFVKSELGMIPKGWRVERIEDLSQKMASGGTPKSLNKDYYLGNIKWYSTKELKDCFLFDSEKHISEDALKNSSAKMFPEGTVLMAIYASPTVGRLGILTNPATFNQAAVGIVPKENVGSEFIYLSLLSERTNLNNLASGAAQQNLNVGIVKNYNILVPEQKVLDRFNRLARGYFLLLKKNTDESRRLAELRDTLLPKLMSGELKVNEVEI